MPVVPLLRSLRTFLLAGLTSSSPLPREGFPGYSPGTPVMFSVSHPASFLEHEAGTAESKGSVHARREAICLHPKPPGPADPHLCSVLKMAKTCLVDMNPFSTSRILRLSRGSMYFFSFS